MVCTSSPHRPGRLQGKGKHPGQFSARITGVCWSIFNAPQQPVFNHKVGGVRVESIGISDATTFPGFCLTHERLFEEFENKKSISTETHIYLQAYRAACRELFRTTFLVEQHDWMMTEYLKSRELGLLRLMGDQLRDANFGDVDLRSISISDDPLVEEAGNRIDPVRKLAKHLENSLLPALQNAVFKSDPSGLFIDATGIDLEIPVAISGSAPFFVNDKGDEKEVRLLISAVPQAGGTLVILGALASEANYVSVYKNGWFTHALSILSMIESWMINGTDQWCLKPSVWHAIPADRQSRLLSQLLSWQRNIGDECDDSIFDEIRKLIITISDAANADNQAIGYVPYIESQRKKMA